MKQNHRMIAVQILQGTTTGAMIVPSLNLFFTLSDMREIKIFPIPLNIQPKTIKTVNNAMVSLINYIKIFIFSS